MASTTTASGGGTGNTQSLAYQLTSGKAYDPDAVYLDASDTKGHYEQLNVKLPPRLQHVIEILVAESDDFRSKQDFIRSALFHYAHHKATTMTEPDPLAVQLIEAEASRGRTEMRSRIREEQKLDFKRASEAVEHMLADRDWYAVNEELDRIAILSEDHDIPEGVRERYSELWAELNDALTREQVKIMKRDNLAKAKATAKA
jgi:Arc/MetJ-type ribon-helix-helix transcriptional regulator